ncbi:FCD domain-containing protein [Actinoplanes sp. NPDC026619]|uniref:FadR/GntR family transcriptional regulator n=1 Tax=Actinoplanes sp. NPDC026619 TaxID=3155798 RepID=UPI0033DCA639
MQADEVIDRIFRPLSNGNVFEEAVHRIMEAIRLGVLAPGERLPTERDLAASLGISRVTLREAIRSLQEADYLVSRRGNGGGTFVVKRPISSTAKGDPAKLRTITMAQAEDSIALRRVLEIGAVELAAGRRHSAAALAGLRESLHACDSSSLSDYRPLDSRLHLTIAELAGAPSVTTAVAGARSRVNHLLDAIPLLPPNIQHSNAQHLALVEAIGKGDVEGARRTMGQHLDATASLLRAFLC